MEYMTTSEAAEKWGVTRRRVTMYLNDGRVKGAEQKGPMWLIPEDAEKPTDPRRLPPAEGIIVVPGGQGMVTAVRVLYYIQTTKKKSGRNIGGRFISYMELRIKGELVAKYERGRMTKEPKGAANIAYRMLLDAFN